jgi:hypothetical protein
MISEGALLASSKVFLQPRITTRRFMKFVAIYSMLLNIVYRRKNSAI